MGRKRKQLQIYEEPDPKQARADSEGDFSENGMPWGSVGLGGCKMSLLHAWCSASLSVQWTCRNSRVLCVTQAPMAPTVIRTSSVTLDSELGRVKTEWVNC